MVYATAERAVQPVDRIRALVSTQLRGVYMDGRKSYSKAEKVRKFLTSRCKSGTQNRNRTLLNQNQSDCTMTPWSAQGNSAVGTIAYTFH